MKLRDCFSARLGSCAVVVGVIAMAAGPVCGWSADVILYDTQNALSESDATGDYTFSLVREWIHADSATGVLVINWQYQSPASVPLYDKTETGPNVTAHARVENAIAPGFGNYAEATIGNSGSVAPGHSYGAGWALEYELVLQPGANVTLNFDADQSSISVLHVASHAGDDGYVAASLKLYSAYIDSESEGGANQPYQNFLISTWAPPEGGPDNVFPSFSQSFQNLTDSEVTYGLWLEGSVRLFAPVPEPTTMALLVPAAAMLLSRSRRV